MLLGILLLHCTKHSTGIRDYVKNFLHCNIIVILRSGRGFLSGGREPPPGGLDGLRRRPCRRFPKGLQKSGRVRTRVLHRQNAQTCAPLFPRFLKPFRLARIAHPVGAHARLDTIQVRNFSLDRGDSKP